jgi:hypothetical protein
VKEKNSALGSREKEKLWASPSWVGFSRKQLKKRRAVRHFAWMGGSGVDIVVGPVNWQPARKRFALNARIAGHKRRKNTPPIDKYWRFI